MSVMINTHQSSGLSPSRAFDSAISGIQAAMKLARFGRLISAIKFLEAANPEISRAKAKAIVESFGYNSETRWPEADRHTIRCL